jgi:hypothetical protein
VPPVKGEAVLITGFAAMVSVYGNAATAFWVNESNSVMVMGELLAVVAVVGVPLRFPLGSNVNPSGMLEPLKVYALPEQPLGMKVINGYLTPTSPVGKVDGLRVGWHGEMEIRKF